jgi:hypothetical protein
MRTSRPAGWPLRSGLITTVIVCFGFTSVNFQPPCWRMLVLPSSTVQCFGGLAPSGTSISM